MKKALITGITGQDGSYLAEFLLEKGYDVGEIDMTVGTSYTAVGEALSAGSADLGFISGGNYVLFSDDCDVLLTARVGQHRHQLPPVLAPLVQDLLGGVDQQRDGGVLPPGRFAHVAELIGRRVLHG